MTTAQYLLTKKKGQMQSITEKADAIEMQITIRFQAGSWRRVEEYSAICTGLSPLSACPYLIQITLVILALDLTY